MQNKNFTIGLLSLTAVVLAIGNYLLPEAAHAQEVVRDRDYSLVTARTNAGADALYVLDHRSGQVAVLMYNTGTRTVEARKVRALMAAFAPATR
ncbi:MAG TPA: hypothetical protein VGN72_04350 [Tepidisphaeraceae bacterium]|jgi:hypothetical protein|nr:hypothetical protein [Tepidisphaeraceae bacterium]